MKKLIVFSSFLLMTFALVACERTAAPETTIEPPEKYENMGSGENVSAKPDSQPEGSSNEKPVLWTQEDPVWGHDSAPLQLVVFSDFQCPFCANFFVSLEKLEKDWIQTKKLKIQFRDFPLSMHKNSIPAHLAANAAQKQGKYIEMHRMLFEQQKSWEAERNPGAIFEGYAKQLGLNLEQYKKDVQDESNSVEIQSDRMDGMKSNVTGTPGSFLNGVFYEGALSDEDLLRILKDAELKML